MTKNALTIDIRNLFELSNDDFITLGIVTPNGETKIIIDSNGKLKHYQDTDADSASDKNIISLEHLEELCNSPLKGLINRLYDDLNDESYICSISYRDGDIIKTGKYEDIVENKDVNPIIIDCKDSEKLSQMFPESTPLKYLVDSLHKYLGKGNNEFSFIDEDGNTIRYEINDDKCYISRTKYSKDGRCLFHQLHILDKNNNIICY